MEVLNEVFQEESAEVKGSDAKSTEFDDKKPIEDFDISETSMRNLQRAGITHLFPVQSQSFEAMTTGGDVMGRSKTGSGKTLAFALPIVERLNAEDEAMKNRRRSRDPRAVVLLPTRELSTQVADEFKRIAPQMRIMNMVGGESYTYQENALRRGVDILVATPGRLIDNLDRGAVDLHDIQVCVLDEADMMLKVGFQEAVERIMMSMPEERQTVLWSATFPSWVNKLSKKYLNEPKWFDLVGNEDSHVPKTVEQKAICAEGRHRAAMLPNVIEMYAKGGSTIVFTETKREVDELSNQLSGFSARALHGDLSQGLRNQTIQAFRRGEFKTLVCTDVAARGLDISNVELVVQYPYLPTLKVFCIVLAALAELAKKVLML